MIVCIKPAEESVRVCKAHPGNVEDQKAHYLVVVFKTWVYGLDCLIVAVVALLGCPWQRIAHSQDLFEQLLVLTCLHQG